MADNIKKRCLNGEKVTRIASFGRLNLRQCFPREFSLEAYPALVALVMAEYRRRRLTDEI